ncbi:RDD family protein [Candidatus Enterococcus willemsii]|uniref:RDD domain-containing protein n=1 Tax=Candidatus Enterococcus willemsii TaxID=1857215 RepID=A0ABQ6Z1B5_9ENTE|nr:RDD family protein [Enterococcus sp. CU12B]KAF1305205.1 hypothetical protein BAU17_12580 [Enterococcus sp. CU12B]
MENVGNLKRRLLVLGIDYLFILLWAGFLFIIMMSLYYFLGSIPTFNEWRMNLLSLTMFGPVFIYSLVTETSNQHATIGKSWMKLVVNSTNNQPIRFRQILVRNIIKYLPWQYAHMLIFRGFALNWELDPFWLGMFVLTYILPISWFVVVVIRKDHRGIHDLVAHTIVEKLKNNN